VLGAVLGLLHALRTKRHKQVIPGRRINIFYGF